jgi:2-hydroxy-6-oxonona-2,4-dienedioate hydrolase
VVRYLAAWLPMVFIAVANGALREAWLSPRLGELRGRQFSTLLLLALFTAYMAVVFRAWPIDSARQAAALGLAWLALTLAFEFLLGRFVSGLAWREMLAQYNLAAGRLWALVPLWIAVAPALFFVYSSYAHDIAQARERIATGSEVLNTRCGPIEYASAGDGPPVLVVHGAGGGFDQGLAFGEMLAKRGLRVIAMSRFGYLRTPLPADASAAAQADAHACLLDALGVRRAAIIGASAGAPSSMQFALRHPERASALVLVVPAAYVPRPGNAPPLTTPAWTQFVFDTALRSDFLLWAAIRLARPALTEAILATPLSVVESASAAEQLRVRRMLDDILPVTARRLGLLNDAAVTSSLARYELQRIAAPTLAISAADDLFGTFDAARYTAG